MNEEIRQLADQCFVFDTEGNISNAYMIERFAVLIVQECASIYNKIDNGNAHLGTENYLEALQKHFGVNNERRN